jgi:hypothetical protein
MLLLSLAEVMQMVDGDATNSGRGCFQRCFVLLLAKSWFFGILPRQTEIFLHSYIVYAAIHVFCCYNR